MSHNEYHYVYIITEKSTGRLYVGSRTSNIDPELDLGYYYLSSSSDDEFIKNQKKNINDYLYEIVETFETREQANAYEIILHQEFDVAFDELFFNRVNAGNVEFCMLGKIVCRDKDNNIIVVDKNDERYLNGELYHHSKYYDRTYASVNLKSRWKDDYDKMMATCQSDLAKQRRSLSVKYWIKNNKEAHMERMMKINTNPEKIRKTAEKHTGMKRSDTTKSRLSDARNKTLSKAKTEDEYAQLTGKGLVFVTNTTNYTYKRVEPDYELQENEVFGQLRDPKEPLKKEQVITNILNWTEYKKPAGYVLESFERRGNKKRVKKAYNEGTLV